MATKLALRRGKRFEFAVPTLTRQNSAQAQLPSPISIESGGLPCVASVLDERQHFFS